VIRVGGDLETHGLGWAFGDGAEAEIVISTRVRLARNLQGFPFPARSSEDDRARVLKTVRAALKALTAVPDIDIWEIDELDERQRDLLLERRVVSRELINEIAIMINEEDHLRIQAITGGFSLEETWRQVDRLDERLGELLAFAFHHEYGFLTACPTNVGTGLRASVLVHLPGLVLTKEIHKVLEGIGQVGLTYRGTRREKPILVMKREGQQFS